MHALGLCIQERSDRLHVSSLERTLRAPAETGAGEPIFLMLRYDGHCLDDGHPSFDEDEEVGDFLTSRIQDEV